LIDPDDIKKMNLNILVDTGAIMLSINETIQQVLQFPIIDKRRVQMANGDFLMLDVAGHIGIKFKNRSCIASGFILPGDSEPLLGAIPMEEMDVVILPLQQKMDVNPKHPDFAVLSLK
jgi:clan AA aspartic protease